MNIILEENTNGGYAMQNRIQFDVPKALQNDIPSYEFLIKLHNKLSMCSDKHIVLNMKNTQFVAANLLSLFGCILHDLYNKNKHNFTISNLNGKIKNVMQRNGFSKLFNWDRISDPNNTTIEYRKFSATTENLEEFEKYTLLNIMNRNDMPTMSPLVKDRIVDNILEIFNNVIDHAETPDVFVCGQYFVSRKKLVITITDLGKTIKKNVSEYLNRSIDHSLKWAIISGNSTKSQDAPGGLGISMLLDFLKLNKGCFTLISANEYLEINQKGERTKFIQSNFPGTIVSITFNMSDDFSYILKRENNDTIVL